VAENQIAETTGSQEHLEHQILILLVSLDTVPKIVPLEDLVVLTTELQVLAMPAAKDANGPISLALVKEDQIAQQRKPGAISLPTPIPEAPIPEALSPEAQIHVVLITGASVSPRQEQIDHGNQEHLLQEDLLQDQSVPTHASMTETAIPTAKIGYPGIAQGMKALLALAIRIQTEKPSLKTRF
jgi:hypothetical protein